MTNYRFDITLFSNRYDLFQITQRAWPIAKTLGVVLVLLLCLLPGTNLNAQTKVSAQLSTSQMTIGDQNLLVIEAELSENAEIQDIDLRPLDSLFSESDATSTDTEPGQLEIMEVGDWERFEHNGYTTASRKIRFTAWKPGAYPIPSLQIQFSQGGNSLIQNTSELLVLVSPPVDKVASDSLALAPIKPIIAEPKTFEDYLPYIIIGLIILAFAIVAYVFYRIINRKKQAAYITIQRPAHEVALEKLTKLKDAKLWQQGDIKAYQSELTYILREYLENRFSIPALESTTSEILTHLEGKVLPTGSQSKIREMLDIADMVKFAKAEPPAEMHERLMSDAEAFIQQTIPVPSPTEDTPQTASE